MKEKLFEEIMESIMDGDSAGVASLVRQAADEGIAAGEILNNALIAGMSEVGVLFKEGEMFVPEVLVASKALQSGIEVIKPLLLADDIKSIGRIMTVTVEGDLHDIGIKLCGLMLEGAGFEVIYIGVDKPAGEIVAKIKELDPMILGMSAMLTTTMANMKEVVDILKEEGLYDKLHVMIGGAPTSPTFGEKIGARYTADANECVSVAKELAGVA
ncbi:MAG: cobalamin-dependent protein [Synergistaceae bacterium]|nr:cobalamin-dependent protein [Synergistaceae bacterium]